MKRKRYLLWILPLGLVSLTGSFFYIYPKWKASGPGGAPKTQSRAPLFEPGDRPTTVYLRAIDDETGKWTNKAAVIRLSHDRANQIKQTLMALLDGPRTGKMRVPVPEGLSLNEFYLTSSGAAVLDLSTVGVKRESVGFLDEALLVRCLIDTLSGNFFEVKQVRILVDGQESPSLFGHYALGTDEVNLPMAAVRSLN